MGGGGRETAVGRDDEGVSIVFDMTKTAVDLQFRISERIDAKVRAYFGFTATVYAVAQAIVLKDDVHSELGSTGDIVSALAIGATVLLLLALGTALHALRPQDEDDVSEANLRNLLRRGYSGDNKAGSDGVNLLIGELHRRKNTNATRVERLTKVIVVSAIAAAVAIAEVAVAVAAVT